MLARAGPGTAATALNWVAELEQAAGAPVPTEELATRVSLPVSRAARAGRAVCMALEAVGLAAVVVVPPYHLLRAAAAQRVPVGKELLE